jgi:hypothetical protein
MAESLHRLVKEALDSGAAASVGEAEEMFKGFRVDFEISEQDAQEAMHQAALLTAVALARRVFLDRVRVACPATVPVKLALPVGKTLGEAIVNLGGELGGCTCGDPLVTFGNEPRTNSGRFHIRTVFEGWRGGIVPAHSGITMSGTGAMPLAPMLAAALAVNECFGFVRSKGAVFGRRAVGMSLWNPSSIFDWTKPDADGPLVKYLPDRLWLIGLGHLGQAFLWALGLLDYPNPEALSVVLQDVDVITPASISTSVLTETGLIGRKKTRALADWCEARGFANVIIERRFKADFRRQPDEPSIALCGVDNALARQDLDQAGFDFIVEAGLGRGHLNYRSMRLHTLPGPRSASSIWKSEDVMDGVESRPAYEKLLKDGDLDRCGITLLAGKAVGAPFVGAVAACLAIAEVLRLLHGGAVHELIELDLQAIEHRTVVPHSFDFTSLNPGYVAAQ